MKKLKPLIGKTDKSWIDGEKYLELFWKKDVLSAVLFYERYRYDIRLLEAEQPKAWGEWCKCKTLHYGRWLLHYTWKDVRK